jgi:hypothetical protein
MEQQQKKKQKERKNLCSESSLPKEYRVLGRSSTYSLLEIYPILDTAAPCQDPSPAADLSLSSTSRSTPHQDQTPKKKKKVGQAAPSSLYRCIVGAKARDRSSFHGSNGT